MAAWVPDPESEASGAAAPGRAGQGRPDSERGRGSAMRGARAAPFRPRPELVLLPLLSLLCHRSRPQGEFWSELVSGALAPRSPRGRKASGCTASLRNDRRLSAPPGAGTAPRGQLGNGGRQRGGSPRPGGGVEALGVATGCGWQREWSSYAQSLGRGIQRPLPTARLRQGPWIALPSWQKSGGSSGSGMCRRLGELTLFPGTLPPPSPGSPGPLQCYGVGPLGDLNCSWGPLGDLAAPSTLHLQSQK